MWFIKFTTFTLILLVNFQTSSLGSINSFTKKPLSNRIDDFNDKMEIDDIGKDDKSIIDLKSHIKNRRLKTVPLKTRRKKGSDDSESSSSVEGQMHWKKEWKLKWANIKKLYKNENITQSGDQVYMVAARPWGVPCGDPHQYDMPWGTCMLPMECEPEFRIYRGDQFCGRTEYVCCGIILNSYDLYQNFDNLDVFSQSSLETDSEELKVGKGKSSSKKKKNKEKKRRFKIRQRRKKAIKNLIKTTMKEISKVLNKTYKFGTKARVRKTKQLKLFIKSMKKKYKQDKQAMKEIHDLELLKVDKKLKKGFSKVKLFSHDFFYNGTFRKWLINGTLTKEGETMLRENYPDLYKELQESGLTPNARRSGYTQKIESDDEDDVEYGAILIRNDDLNPQ